MIRLPAAPRILLSRTDAIGDVVLSLPMASILRARYPDAVVGFLGKAYTRDVVACCEAVDTFVLLEDFLRSDHREWDVIIHVFPVAEIARKAAALKIPYRIGTSSRLFHWLNFNLLVKLNRKNSSLHESQLNVLLLKPLGITDPYSTEALGRLTSFRPKLPVPEAVARLRDPQKHAVILHPRSQGSAREWGLEQFSGLIARLTPDRFQIFISGTGSEGDAIRPWLDSHKRVVTDLTGRLSLAEFIAFIGSCDTLVAASTGPLHLAAALGIQAIGIYPPIRPMHAGRWGPIGARAVSLSAMRTCEHCRRQPADCRCMSSVQPKDVAEIILQATRNGL